MNDPEDEPRRYPRRHILKGARVVLDDGSVIECLVRNVSESGALLSLSDGSFVPNEFELSIGGESAPRSVHAIWKAEGNVGVRFDLRSNIKHQVLSESNFRCGMPTCRSVLESDPNPFVRLDDRGVDIASNIIALCPTCQQLHEKGTITRKVLENFKSCLITLSAAFDARAIELLLFLAKGPRESLIVTGDGVLRVVGLLTAGLAEVATTTGGGSEVRYAINITAKGQSAVDAWKAGNLRAFRTAITGRRLPDALEPEADKMLFFNQRHSR